MPRPATPSDVVAAVAALAGQHPGRAVFVGIDGLGAAGKSTLADLVARSVPRAVVVRTDDFDAQPEWDWPRFLEQVHAPLAAGQAARYEVAAWDVGTTGEWRTVPPDAVLVLEGVSSTRTELAVPWHLSVWVDTPRDVRRRRALDRDGPATQALWEQHWIPSEEAYAARERPFARVDLVVPGIG